MDTPFRPNHGVSTKPGQLQEGDSRLRAADDSGGPGLVAIRFNPKRELVVLEHAAGFLRRLGIHRNQTERDVEAEADETEKQGQARLRVPVAHLARLLSHFLLALERGRHGRVPEVPVAQEYPRPTRSAFHRQGRLSAAIEGSTVQRQEVPEILHKASAENAEEIETKGVARAVAYIKKSKEDLSIKLLNKLHEICFEGSKSFAGQFRNVEVAVVDSKGKILHRGVSVSQLDLALKEMVSWYKENKKKFRPLVLAAIIHNQFEYIHPFQDGNGRVGRLLLNFILLKNNYPPINITLEDRAEYYLTLQEYQINQNLKPTVEFLVKQYKKTIRKVTTKNKKP